MQMAVFREGEMAPDAVDRDAHQLCIEPAKLGQQLLVERQLIRTDRAPVFRIEGEDDRLAAELRQRDGLIGCRWKLEVGRLGAGREWGRTLYRLLHQIGDLLCAIRDFSVPRT